MIATSGVSLIGMPREDHASARRMPKGPEPPPRPRPSHRAIATPRIDSDASGGKPQTVALATTRRAR